jgi:hypothetical protein
LSDEQRDGGPPAGSSDRDAIEAMWDRCSPATRYARLHSPCPALPTEYLDAVFADPRGSRVCTDGSRVVGLASLVPGTSGAADLGVVVEDAWQGIGTRLVVSLAAGASAQGVSVITATVLASHAHLAHALRRLPGDCTISARGLTVEATVRLPERWPRRRDRCGRQSVALDGF